MPPNLPPSLASSLSALARHCGAERLVLFGSRARGDHRDRSDVDLAVFGLSPAQAGRLRLELEELPTLLKFDLVCAGSDTSPALLQNIQQEGVVLYAADEM